MTTGNLSCVTLTVSGAATTGALTCSGLLTANGGLTVASGQTLTLTGATVAGAPTWSSNQAITLSTAAQPNITSVGALTAGSIGGSFGAINVGSNSISGGAISGTTGSYTGLLQASGTGWIRSSGVIQAASAGSINLDYGGGARIIAYGIGGADIGSINLYNAKSDGTGAIIHTFSSTGLAVTGALTSTSYLGVNGAAAAAPTAGYGTPTGNSITINFPGATATLAQTTGTLAQVILDLKRAGIILN